MKFGVQADQDTQTSGGGDSNFIRYINKDGEWQLRFLEEFEDWIAYWEHFSMAKRCSYPCTGDRETCPGCNSENEKEAKASKKYLFNAIYRDPKASGSGYVNLWKVTASIRADILRFREKAGGTLTDRDYTIIRNTDGNRTTYSVDREDKEPIDLEQYKSLFRDKQEALNEAFEIAWDDEKRAKRDKDFEDRKAAKEETKKPPKKEEPQEEPFILKSQEERDRITAEQMKDHPGGLDEFAQPKLEVVKDEPEPEIKLTVAEIKKMSLPKLQELYNRAGLEMADTEDRKVLADNLISQLSGV